MVVESTDPLEVLEYAMRYFFALAIHLAKGAAPMDDVSKCLNRAAALAAQAAPYRHPRLSAIKHVDAGIAGGIDGIRADATPEELRAEIAKRPPIWRPAPDFRQPVAHQMGMCERCRTVPPQRSLSAPQ
jgi:hypothetical protein